MREELAKELLEKILECKENWIKPWRNIARASDGFYYENFAYSYDKHLYQGINQLLLPAGVYLTFEGAKKRGFKMIKGSKGFKILVPKICWFEVDGEKELEALEETGAVEVFDKFGNKYRKEDGIWKRSFIAEYKTATVFHHSSFSNITLPKCDTLEVKTISENANGYPFVSNYAEAQGIKIYEGGNDCYFNFLENSIAVPKMEMFSSKEKFYLSLFHELVHSTGLPLKRKLVGYMEDQKSYAFEEVIAETGALVLGQELQVGDEETEHFAYLKEWSTKVEPSALIKAITQGINAATYLLSYN